MKETVKNKLHLDWNGKAVVIFVLWSFVVNLIIETLQRVHANGVLTGGLFGGVVAIYKQPFVFFYGMLLIMTILSLSFLFKRRYLVMLLLSFVWIGFAVADFLLLSYRVTPFSVIEVKLIEAALGVLNKYVSTPTLIGIIAVAVGAVVALIICWRKVPKIPKVNYFQSVVIIAVMALLVWGSTALGFATKQLSTNFPNLANAYLDYGFVYCFINGIDMGIHKPEDYSSEKVSEIISGTYEPEDPQTSESAPTEEAQQVIQPNMTGPNVIFLQLESFFDITAVQDLKMSADPVPFFRALKQQYSSGYLSVPAIGAGTANTEFEVMTGMNLDFFGPGEYPYKTVLQTHTCESMAYNLKENGYTAHAIHNNRANFYSRDKIFSQLGYDDFTSIEVMNIPETEYTPNGWAKDKCLTKEILKVLDSTANRDYVYTISVQGHGKYPKEQLIEDPAIRLLGGIDDDRWYGVEYYINEIHEMDQFLQELVRALKARQEPTILVAYGDHLPGLGFTEDQLINKDMNQTEYIIWDNMGLEKTDEDIEAYQLASRVLERIDIKTGIINAYHQANKNVEKQEYLDNLKILGYDMLYGDMDATGGENKYIATDLKFGVANVAIHSIMQDPDDPAYLIIKGDNFTQYSRVMSGEERLNAELIDEHTMRAMLPDTEEGERVPVQVIQSYKGKLTLQTSNELGIIPVFPEQQNDEDYQNNNDNFGE